MPETMTPEQPMFENPPEADASHLPETCHVCGLPFDNNNDHKECEQVEKQPTKEVELTEEQKKGVYRMVKYLQEDNINKAKKIITEFGLSQEFVQDAVKQSVIYNLQMGFSVKEIIAHFNLSEENIQSKEVQDAVKQSVIYNLQKGHSIKELIVHFNLPAEIMQFKGVQDAAKQGILHLLKFNDVYSAKGIITELSLSQEDVQDTIKQGFIYSLQCGSISTVKAIITEFNLSEEFVRSKEVQYAAKQGVIFCFGSFHIDTAKAIITEFNLSKEIQEYVMYLPRYSQETVSLFGLNTVDELVKFNVDNNRFVEYLQKTPDQGISLEKTDLPLLKTLHINLIEAEELKRKNINLPELAQNNDYQNLYEKLKENSEDWQDEQNIQNTFERGAQTFGFDKMFAYLDKKGISRHDGLHAFHSIVSLQDVSGLDPTRFYNQILEQVKKDGATYEEGSSHHHFNAIVQTLSQGVDSGMDRGEKYVQGILQQANEYKDIVKLQELAKTFSAKEDVFVSWSSLKKFSELSQLLEKTEILDELQELKKEGKTALYNYVETLAFHPTAKVDMSAVMQFWREPERFLSADDDHTPEKVQNRKKPSNYVEIPHLDLIAPELRDALVEGVLDELQVFSPLEITYTFDADEEESSLREEVKKALGSFKEKIEGKAKNPKKLFSEIGKILKAKSLDLKKYLNGEEEIDEQAKEEITTVLFHPDFGMAETSDTIVLVAKINKKSDPDGVLAGNDTACCMPFGSGKNNVYTFNPDTSLFTLQIKRSDGSLRTIAQSVLTKDKDVKKAVPEIIEEMEKGNRKMTDIVSEQVLNAAQSYVACDNVEVNPNFKEDKYAKLIERAYRDFFAQYVKRYAAKQNLHTDKVIIGKGYSDTLRHLPTEKNTFVPLAPVGYSDKFGENVYVLNLDGKPMKLKRKIKEAKESPKKETPLPNISGLDYLTFEDTLAVSYLEGKAYADNESLITYLHNMENGLIAKDINNAAKNRPNMSLKYTDEKGKMRGYILAYEGKMGTEDDNSEDIIYISDLASDRENKLAGGRLIKGFIELYKKNYLEKGEYMPVYMEARENTSYQIIKNQLDKIGEELGVVFEMEELGEQTRGRDTMHSVIIRAVES